MYILSLSFPPLLPAYQRSRLFVCFFLFHSFNFPCDNVDVSCLCWFYCFTIVFIGGERKINAGGCALCKYIFDRHSGMNFRQMFDALYFSGNWHLIWCILLASIWSDRFEIERHFANQIWLIAMLPIYIGSNALATESFKLIWQRFNTWLTFCNEANKSRSMFAQTSIFIIIPHFET